MGRKWAAAALVLAVFATVACSGGEEKPAAKPKGTIVRVSTPKPATAWDKISLQIKDGKISKDGALEAFALAHDLEIPGVEIPSGSRSDGVSASGTLVREWIEEYRDQLTPQQRAVVDRVGKPNENDVTVTLAPKTDPVIERGITQGTAGQSFVRASVSDDFIEATEATVYEMLGRVAGKLGVPVIERGWPDLDLADEVFGRYTNIRLRFSDYSDGNTLMETNASQYSGPLGNQTTPCAITVFRGAWAGETATAGALSDRLRVLLAHEVIHCYQNTVNGLNSNAWIDEGTATWGATNMLGVAEPGTASFFKRWIDKPWMPLGSRTYDAVGFWSLAARNGRDLWGNFIAIWNDDSTTGALAAIGADGADMSATWAPSEFNRGDWGGPWNTPGVGVPNAAGFNQDMSISEGGGVEDMRDGYTAMNYMVSGVDDEVLVMETISGSLSYRDAKGRQGLGIGYGVYCMTDSCVCPPKTKLAGKDMASAQLSAPFGLGFYGGSGGAVLRMKAYDLEELCGTKKPKDPPRTGPNSPSDCGSRCAGSNGDPHLTTLDGQHYDFQAAGEYVLLRDPAGALQIQVRQEPFLDRAAVAINTAVAVQMSSHVISARIVDGTANQGEPQIEFAVDGKKVSKDAGLAKALEDEFINVQIRPQAAVLTGLDGTQVYIVTKSPSYGVQVQVAPNAALRKRGVGLLGSTHTESAWNLPRLRDRREARGASQGEAIYDALGPSWLVTEGESILPGNRVDPSDYPGFPDRTPFADVSAETRAAAEKRCSTIQDEALHNECVFDVLYGDKGFSENYEQLDAFYTDGPSAFSDKKVSSSGTPGVPTPEKGAKPVAGLKTIWANADRFVGAAISGDGETVFAAAALADDHFEISRTDVTTGVVTAVVKSDQLVRDIVFGGDAPWVVETMPDYSGCFAVRLDPTSLAEVARLKIECGVIDTRLLSSGDRVWVFSTTHNAAGDLKFVLQPIDPTANTLGEGIPYPNQMVFSTGGGGNLFFSDTDGDGAAVLLKGQTEFKKLPNIDDMRFVVSDGVWLNSSNRADKYDFSGELVTTIDLDGFLVAVANDTVFIERFDEGHDYLIEIGASGDAKSLGKIPMNKATKEVIPLYNATKIFVTDKRFVAVVPIVGDGNTVVQLYVAQR